MKTRYFMIQYVRKIVVFVIGLTLVVIGIALLVLPGPGIVTIMFGLGVLSLEFLWAKRLFKKAKAYSKDRFEKFRNIS